MAIVVPLTTVDRGLPHHVAIGTTPSGLERPSWARTEDVRAISEQRLSRSGPLGVVAADERDAIRGQLRLMIDF
jgi:mRNA interferase MazF